ncbi:MutH/Sau3AI family endonuclease [Candidatus Thioglobus sp.]|nr:MutH/Sau3AI family endonuclease [Candidatus Thioglobus sp.]
MQKLDIKEHFHYDHTDEESIMERARMLKGKTLGFVSDNSPYEKDLIKKTNKGKVGNFIEKHWFGIPNNSRPEPDFAEAGIELKVCSINKNKGRTVKWNQKICSINYVTLHDEEWISSHTKLKINKVLFVYYLSDDADNPWSSQIVLDVDLWELKSNEELIVPEWESARNKVRKGLAHKLTISGCKYLGANTSGTSKLVPQPVTKYQKLAKERSFYFQRSFVDIHWQEVRKSESVIESLSLSSSDNYESDILNAISHYEGKTMGEIANIFNTIIPGGKAAVPSIIKLAIGFKSVKSKIKEFEQLGILVKTFPVRTSDMRPWEAVSFPAIKIKEFTKEDWDESTLLSQIGKILFVPFSAEKSDIKAKDKKLYKPFFWSPNSDEITLIKHEWETYKAQASKKLNIFKKPGKYKKGYKEIITNLSNESETKIIHIRPHGRDSDDRDEDNYGTSVVKQSFWLNKGFLQKLLNQSLNE